MPLSVCPACRLPSSRFVAELPCEECLASLLTSPEICARCLGFTCPSGECARGWLAVDGEDGRLRFDSVTSVYLSVGPGARVLKSWKTAPSPALTRHLLRETARRVRVFPAAAPVFLIPVPQNASRRWELAGGSALRVCAMIRRARGNPADRVLDFLEVGPRDFAQAKSRGDERYSRRASIRARKVDGDEATFLEKADLGANPRLVLVDDFLTSGSTLRAAAGAARGLLEELGWFGGGKARLDVFVLGFRPAIL